MQGGHGTVLTSILFSLGILVTGHESSDSSMSSSSSSSSSVSSSSLSSSSLSSAALSSSGGWKASSSSSSSPDKDHVDRLHPAHDEYACKYSGDWGDCDPFKMIRIKEQRLISGSATCQDRKNITKPCSREDFPPGTNWLLDEHKQCVAELQKLKSMIEDLHRYIDLIHQRGQSLFNAYNELRKRLMDVRREISIIGRRNHDAEQTIKRLKVEMEDWKEKSNTMQMELNQLKAQYKEMENKVKISKTTYQSLTKTKEQLSLEQTRLNQKMDLLNKENRNLKTSLLDAERYKEEHRDVSEIIALLKRKISDIHRDIKKTKEDLQKARMEGAMPKAKKYAPKFNKDTKVNLDMSMWITHNITKEEQESYAPQIIPYEVSTYAPYVEPEIEYTTYQPPSTTSYATETPYQYQTPPEPKYEAPPKYEEPEKEEVPEFKY